MGNTDEGADFGEGFTFSGSSVLERAQQASTSATHAEIFPAEYVARLREELQAVELRALAAEETARREHAKRLKAEEKIRELVDLVSHDHLTELLNQRGGAHGIAAIFSRVLRNNIRAVTTPKIALQTIAMIIIDIDFFKSVNDTYGHEKGDEVLRAVAGEIKKCFQRVDDVKTREDVIHNLRASHDTVTARDGGEEFVIACVGEGDAFIDGIRKRVDKLRKAIRENCSIPATAGKKERIITASFGIAFLTPDESHKARIAETIAELKKLADQNLYYAKAAGRDWICASHEDIPSEPAPAGSPHTRRRRERHRSPGG